MRMAEIAAPVLKGFDIVYLQDWGNAGFHLIRERRYSRESSPTCITILHGPSEWELSSNGKYPELPNDLHLAYQERSSAKHGDFVISPTRYMAEHLKQLGWEFPSEPQVPARLRCLCQALCRAWLEIRASSQPISWRGPQSGGSGSWHRVSTVPRL